MRESILHFVFHCAQFEDARQELMYRVEEEYDGLMDEEEKWMCLTESDMWRSMLFPVQEEMAEARDKEVREQLLDKRMRIIDALLKYVFDTGRFMERRPDDTFYNY